MNKAILMGRLTRDPEIRYPQNPDSKPVARFSLAVDRRFKRDGEPDADFFNCTCFSKLAEFTEKYLRKGSKILVEGAIHNDTYTNKDGQKVYSVNVIVENMEFAENKRNSENTRSDNNLDGFDNNSDGFMNIPDGIDSELPFA